MPFNKEQQKAIDSDANQNVLISAGAGSGKTKTLSYKVYKVCAEDHIPPSRLLVLTFTNKAAFEMKERIIAQFRENDADGKCGITDEILSSHIQTFDSFSLYLVQQYSRLLGVPSTISILDENILSAKANSYLEGILKELYDKKDEQLQKTLSKFTMGDDSVLKTMILDIDRKLRNLLPSEREEFIRDYDRKFLSKEFFDSKKEEFLEGLKKKLQVGLKKVVLFSSFHGEEDIDALIEDLKHVIHQDIDLENVTFGEERLDSVYKLALFCLKADEEELMETARTQGKRNTELWDMRSFAKEKDKAERTRLKQVFQTLREVFLDGFLNVLGKLGPFDDQYEAVLSFKEDIHFLFAIIDKLDEKLSSYKFLANAYSFQDISNMALSLLIDEKYKKAGDEIRDRFRYILVDEYQDTNDFQEAFLNAISEKATLFTVGDAKQAIYGFRNSNCQLFLDRRERYKNSQDGNHVVIDMNKNYRSVEKVLDDVNAIFENYMGKEHGGILYTGMERLEYDEKADVFALAKDNKDGEYGIQLLNYADVPEKYQGDKVASECLAIVKDIQDKIQKGYPVLDFVNGKLAFRPCRYGDFAILIRKRSHFDVYQKIFLDQNVPLNDEIETGYHDIDAILAIQSLVKLISYFLGQSKENFVHLYLSVARSFLFGKKEGYDDETIYKTLQDEKLLEKDKILLKVKAFIQREKEESLSLIFLHLLEDFDVLRKLSDVGDVSNNASKIESYYQLLVGQENAGEGLSDFVALFKDIDRYDIGLSASSVTALENAVSLMTIHQSKGLEFKIVYMPLCDNSMTFGNNMNQPVEIFSRTEGILLPDYRYKKPIDTFLKSLYLQGEGSKVGETSEHVRLFYVALTRPKETLYIVGNKEDLSSRNEETLLDMLSSTFHYEGINKELEQRYEKLFPIESLSHYRSLVKLSESCAKKRLFFQEIADPDEKEIALFLFDTLVQDKVRDDLSKAIDDLRVAIYDDLVDKAAKDEVKRMRLLICFYTGKDPGKDIDAFLKTDGKILDYAYLPKDREGLLKASSEFLDALLDARANDFTKDHEIVRKADIFTSKPRGMKDEEEIRIACKKRAANSFLPALLLAVDDRKEDFLQTYYPLFHNRVVSLVGMEKGELSSFKAPEFEVDDTPIPYPIEAKKRASKFLSDEESPSQDLLDRGTLLHRYMETIDLTKRKVDDALVQDPADRKILENVLALPLFDGLENARILREYPYYDTEFHTNGSIDLLLVKEKEIDIVDYKLKNIDDDAYKDQLKTYRRNVERLFGKDKKIRTFLLSLVDHHLEEVETE